MQSIIPFRAAALASFDNIARGIEGFGGVRREVQSIEHVTEVTVDVDVDTAKGKKLSFLGATVDELAFTQEPKLSDGRIPASHVIGLFSHRLDLRFAADATAAKKLATEQILRESGYLQLVIGGQRQYRVELASLMVPGAPDAVEDGSAGVVTSYVPPTDTVSHPFVYDEVQVVSPGSEFAIHAVIDGSKFSGASVDKDFTMRLRSWMFVLQQD